VILLAREDEVHFHAVRTMTEQFQLCECVHCRLGNLHRCSEMTSGSRDAPHYPVFHSAMKGINGTNKILHHDIAAQTIIELLNPGMHSGL
jgi:hypothetical protein